MHGTAGSSDLNFISGGGEMGAAIRARDWSGSPVGPPDTWPAELRTVIRLMLTTEHPVFIFWGPELTCFYNDAYSQSLGPERHPGILGAPGREVWDEIWDIIGPQIEQVMRGDGATWHRDQLVPITRHGKREDVYWTYSYSPIDDRNAPTGVGGVLVICNETTELVEAEKVLQQEVEIRKMLFGEMQHRVTNSLQIVSSLLHLEGSAAKSRETRESLERASSRVYAISAVHELLFRAQSVETVQIDAHLEGLCDAIAASISEQNKIAIHCEAEQIGLPTKLVMTISLLINELVTNAVKHAFPDGRAGEIRIELHRDGDTLVLMVADNGVGETGHDGTGLGSRIIDGLVGQAGGQCRMETNAHGYMTRITIPLEGENAPPAARD